MGKFTKGPWQALLRTEKDCLHSADIMKGDERIGSANVRYHLPVEANAYLMAAAPEMYEALKAVREECPVDPDINADWYAAWQKLEAALAKATGND